MTTRTNPWIVCFDKRPSARMRLLCFPHAGASTTTFATWHRELPPEIELCAVQLPGRDQRRDEPFRLDMRALVAELFDGLAAAHDRYVALFGYSLGALIAFEYARRVRDAGAGEPDHLFVAARRAPQLPTDPPIAGLADADFVRETIRRYEGIPKAISDDRDLLAYFLPAIRADVTLLESYVHEAAAPLSCPITAFAGETDPHVDRTALEAWSRQTTGPFSAHAISGGHFFITESRPVVLRRIADALRGRS